MFFERKPYHTLTQKPLPSFERENRQAPPLSPPWWWYFPLSEYNANKCSRHFPYQNASTQLLLKCICCRCISPSRVQSGLPSLPIIMHKLPSLWFKVLGICLKSFFHGLQQFVLEGVLHVTWKGLKLDLLSPYFKSFRVTQCRWLRPIDTISLASLRVN